MEGEQMKIYSSITWVSKHCCLWNHDIAMGHHDIAIWGGGPQVGEVTRLTVIEN